MRLATATREGGTQLLAGAPSSSPGPAGPQTARRQHQSSWKARACSPSCLLALGAALLAVGAALVAAPLALHAASGRSAPPLPAPSPPAPPSTGLDAEGVPLDAATQAADQQDSELVDCGTSLIDREAYQAAAASAEASLLGSAAAELPQAQLAAAVAGLPPLLFGTVFWVLVSEEHPWKAPEFPAAAAAQVESLNAAFAGLNITFRLDAVVAAPADDAAVTGCSAAWDGLAAQLLPAQANGSSTGSLPAADPSTIHVVVCEPEGVRGAAAVLGGSTPAVTAADGSGGGGSGGGATAAGGTILLRRSAMWLSHTSLVHQLGHFLGLPHPFPDERQTCKLDGDAVADTPLQYAPNQGCEPDGGDLHVCQDSSDGPLPVTNFMDLTNDTCRRHFTPGQAARMQAMLRAQRPQLFAAGLVAPQPQAALSFEAAWQSGLPAAAVQAEQAAAFVQRQAAAAAAASAASSSGGYPPGSSSRGNGSAVSARQASQRFADPWSQAAQAADGSLSAATPDCACLGPDTQGRVLWAGQLNASYAVHAVRLLLPIQLNSSSGSGDADATSTASGSQAAPALLVDIRVGDSLDHAANQQCSPSGSMGSDGPQPPVLLLQQQALHMIACQPAVAGRYVTVALAAPSAQHQRLCLCEVQPLSVLAPAVTAAALPGAVGSNSRGGNGRGIGQALPAVPLNATLDMSASQAGDRTAGDSSSSGSNGGSSSSSSSISTTPASSALASESPSPGRLLGRPACSRSGAERPTWWSLDTGLDGAWLRGLRLSVPFACQPGRSGSSSSTNRSQAAPECVPVAATSLSVYVGNLPPAELLAGSSASRQGSLCGGAVQAFGGQPVEIDCGRFIHGRYVTVVAAAQANPASLSLCGVQLLGAIELLPGQHMLASSAQQVQPLQLQPLFALPIDGVRSSCLEAPASASSAGGARWQLQLDGTYPLLAVRLAAQPAPAAARQQPGLVVTLLDAGGGAVSAWQPLTSQAADSGNQSSSVRRDFMWELPAATPAAAVRVEGFATLCELQVLSAAPLPLPSYQLPSSPQWRLLGGAPDSAAGSEAAAGNSSSAGGGTGSPGWQLLDGDPGTCLTAQPPSSSGGGSGSGSNVSEATAAHFTVLVGKLYRLHSVRIVAGGAAPAVVSIMAPNAPCRPAMAVRPWQPAVAACADAPVLTDRLTIRLAGPGNWLPSAQTLTLCEVSLFGLPAG